MTEEKVVGYYSAAYKLFEVVILLPTTFMLVLFPYLVSEFYENRARFQNNFKKVLAIYSLTGGAISLVLWGFASEIITLIYGENFFPATPMLNILAWAASLYFINFLLSNILIASSREVINTWNLGGVTVLNIVLNLALIPQYGAMGATWATLFCEGILILALGLQVQKLFR